MQYFLKKNFYSAYCALLFFSVLEGSWTHTYHFFPKNFSGNQHNVVIQKRTHEPFNQLLVSWNAAAPMRGYLRFFLEVLDDETGAWSTYKMYEWGPSVSRSFFEKDKHSSARYAYVRFEGQAGKKYHQFRVKMVALDGASTSVLHSMSVCASDMTKFKPEMLETYSKKGRLISIKGVPSLSQHLVDYPESSGWCSPASLLQVIQFYSHKEIDLVTLAQQVYDSNLDAYGSWPFNTAITNLYLPKHLGYVTRLASLKNLIDLLKSGHPVILSIYSSRPLPGAPKAYDKGHLITVVGIDLRKGEILCHDTAEKDRADTIKRYPLKPFIKAWESRYRLAYVIVPKRV